MYLFDLDVNVKTISFYHRIILYDKKQLFFRLPANRYILFQLFISMGFWGFGGSIFLRPAIGSEPAQLFRMYTPLDLYEMIGIEKRLDQNELPECIDAETFLVNVQGHTFF